VTKRKSEGQIGKERYQEEKREPNRKSEGPRGKNGTMREKGTKRKR